MNDINSTSEPKSMKKFELKIYCGKSNNGSCEYEVEGDCDQWSQYTQIKLPGFDGSVSLSLEGLWENAIQSKHNSISEVITGYETIVKFGSTQQLKTSYFVELLIEYKH